jgi:hypothetical protein
VRYVDFADVFNRACGVEGRVLHLGCVIMNRLVDTLNSLISRFFLLSCGNSNVAADAAIANPMQYHVNVDFSSVVMSVNSISSFSISLSFVFLFAFQFGHATTHR